MILSTLLAGALGLAAQDSLDRVFASAVRADGPGCAVDVRRGGTVLARRGYGLANLEHPAPITPDTVFEAGSVAKQVTAALVAILAERGRLAMEDSVRRWLPELPPVYQPVTIRMLLDHSAGVREWGALADLSGWSRGSRAYGLHDVLAMMVRQRGLSAAPGGEFIYSNGNYVLAALVVERASGQSLQAFSQAALFVPLGMAATRWRDDHRIVLAGRAAAYLPRAGGGWQQGTPFEDVVGPGGLLTTVGDLQRFTAALATQEAKWTRRMGRPVALADGTMATYATGLDLGPIAGQAAVSHSGATGGYRAWAGRFPASGLSVALLCNAGSVDGGTLGPAVAALYLPTQAAPATAPAPVGDAVLYRDPANDAVAEVRTAAGGTWVNGSARIVRRQANAALLVERAGNAPRRLVPATRWSPDTAAQATLAGRYRSAEADGDIVLAMADGRLEWVDPRGDRVALVPTITDTLTGWGWQMRIVRDGRGRATGLIASTGGARQMAFARVPE